MNSMIKSFMVAGMLALSSSVSAAPILGSITFGGPNTFDHSTNSVDITGTVFVTSLTDTFITEGVSGGDSATYNDFSYSPISGASPLWSVGGFSFTLTSVTTIDETNPDGLFLQGFGDVSFAGYDDTRFAWSFSSDTTGTGTFAFSSVNSNAPEPGIAMLLGLGLLGLGVSRKLRKQS